jgi:site-specific DNA recombinase
VSCKVDELHKAIVDPATRPEALTIIRSLIDRIAVVPTSDGFEIELVGEIANMVALASNPLSDNKKAAPAGAAVLDRFRSSVKVVAGRGFEPLTFRL